MGESPKIIKEIRKEIKVRPPPGIPKLNGLDLNDWDLTDDWTELFISHNCIQKMVSHCDSWRDKQIEVMGLIIGDIFQWRNRVYTIAEDTVAAEIEDSTATSVKFGIQGLQEVATALNNMEYEYMLVGWYHSHPGFTCFLSEKDLETQKRTFNKPYHATIVIDPISRQFRSYKVIEDEYIEKRYQLFAESEIEKELSTKKRKELMSYIDALVQRQTRPKGQHGEPTLVPTVAADPAPGTNLPPEVRSTLEADIKKMIEEHQKKSKK